MTTAAAAESIPAELLHDAIRELGVTHVVTVPDTHQKTLLSRLFEDTQIRVITVSTEDDAIGVYAGLYMGGALARGAGYAHAENFDDIGVLRERLPGLFERRGPVMIALEVAPGLDREEMPRLRPDQQVAVLRAQLAG